MKPETTNLIRELQGMFCRCSKSKQSGHSFCPGCYKNLPADLQKALYLKMGRGYEEAYRKACQFLDEQKHISTEGEKPAQSQMFDISPLPE